MPNSYYTRTMNPQPTQRVGSNDIKSEFQSVQAGFDGVASDSARAIKLPVGTADQTIGLSPASRANLVLAFDASGNISAISYGRWRGDWATATAYVVSDCFRDPATKNIYSTVSAHTSGVLATDIAAGKVQLAINVEDVEAAKADAQAAAATATTQAGIASASATTATTKAGEAVASASAASASATAAGGSASSASTSAATATTQAGIATTKAAEAAASAASIAGGPVTSVNGKTGIAVLSAADVGAQSILVSGTNIKTVGGVSILGAGDIAVSGASTVTQRTITSADTLISSDQGKLINCSGTFTLSVTAAATLGNGWWCYVRNTGTGVVTLDPDGTEMVDGVSTGSVAGTILLACNGTSFTAVKIGGFDTLQLLTSGTSWTAPLGVRRARVRGVGGGGGGGRSSDAAEGSPGAGSGYFEGIYPTTPGTAYTYAIGAAGVKASATGAAGTAGGNTSITINGVTLTGNGGGAGQASFASSSVGGAASNGQINISGSSGVCYSLSGSGATISVPGSSTLGLGSVHSGRQGYGYGGRGGTSSGVGDNGAAGVIILEY